MDPYTATLNLVTKIIEATIVLQEGASPAQREQLVQNHIDVVNWFKGIAENLRPK